MNTIIDSFVDSIKRDGKDILIGTNKYKVLFKINNKGNTIPYITMFALCDDNIEQGQIFSCNGEKYLILKENTAENLIYKKYDCIKCNSVIKWIYGKNDLILYDAYTIDMNEAIEHNKSYTIATSKLEIIMPLNESTKRILPNERFFCGSFHATWKIVELNYLNNLCYLYAERDVILPIDDNINGIANRWNYEEKPTNYSIEINETDIEIEQDSTIKLTVVVSKDSSVMVEQPIINWTIDDSSICSVDSANLVKGLKVGLTKITGSYKVKENDICITDSVTARIKEKPVVVGNIVVTPVYNTTSYYRILQGTTKAFTCSISGLNNPIWNITLNPSSNTATNYTSTIDNANGTFTVLNKAKSSYYLTYTITEQTTGKVATYQILLGGIM